MMKALKQVTIRTRKQWREWLRKHHLSEERVLLISYKRHTKKEFINHRTQIEEAICFGWIDTTVKRLDEDRFGRVFVKRKPSANWSKNTLSYAEKLLATGKMSAFGKKMFFLGKKKKPFDHDTPKVFSIPEDLKKAFSKSKKARDVFDAYSPSARKAHLKWLFSAKREETRKKRIKQIVAAASKGEKVW